MKLDGKRALVVGASSGVGLATARLFASEGADVAVCARSVDKLNALASDLGDRAHVVVADVSDTQAAQDIVPKAVSALGGLDIAVYSAGIITPCLAKDMTVETFESHITVNLTGNFIVARDAACHMKDNGGGTVINIGSELSFMGMPYYVHYCSAKAGVIGLTKSLAAEMAPEVTVNAICPGPIDTPMLDTEIEWFGGTQEVRDGAFERVPLKRLASPEEIAMGILFLAADAPFATGSTLVLDGGTTMI